MVLTDNTAITEQRKIAPLMTCVKTRGNSYSSVSSILASAQALSSSWTDLGTVIDMEDFSYVNVYVELTINNSTDVQFRSVVNIDENPTVDYQFVIENIETTKINVAKEYIELLVNEDSNIILEFKADGARYLQIQARAGTVGATAGTIDSLYTQRSMK